MVCAKRFNQPRQKVGCYRGDDSETQAPHKPFPRAPGQIRQSIHRQQYLSDGLRNFFPEAGKANLSGAALEERGAQGFFHFPDLNGERRLRYRASFGGAAKMAVAGERFEIAKLSERQVYHKN